MPWSTVRGGRYVDPGEVGVTVDTYPDSVLTGSRRSVTSVLPGVMNFRQFSDQGLVDHSHRRCSDAHLALDCQCLLDLESHGCA